MLQATGEEALCHPMTSDRDEALNALIRESPDGLISVQDEHAAYNYESSFKIISPCCFYDCPVCFVGELQIFAKKRLFLLVSL